MINISRINSFKDKLDPKIIIIILFVGVIEYELFELGRSVTIAAKRDAWLSVLLGGLLLNLIAFLLYRLIIRFPQMNFFSVGKKVWGKPLGYLIIFFYIFYWFSFNTLLLRNTSDINQAFFLEQTPVIIPLILFGAGGYWLVVYGFPTVSRFFSLLFPFLIIPLIVTSALVLPGVKGGNFMPFLEDGLMPVIEGAIVYVGMFQGIEVLLFLGPLLTTTNNILWPTLIGINLLNLFAFFQVVGTIGLLGITNIEHLNLPAFAMLQLMEVPGLPVERFELLFTLPLLIGLFTTYCLFIYLISLGIFQVIGYRYKNIVILAVALITICGTYFIPNFAWSLEARTYLTIANLFFLAALPILTLILAIIAGKEDKGNDKEVF